MPIDHANWRIADRTLFCIQWKVCKALGAFFGLVTFFAVFILSQRNLPLATRQQRR